MQEQETSKIKAWAKAALIRAIKTAAQSAIAAIGATTLLTGVDWGVVASTVALAFVLSILTSVAGIPEVDGGASVATLSKGKTEVG